MNGVIATVSGSVDQKCHVSACRAQGCSLSLNGLTTARVIVDLDCGELGIRDYRKRCDYVFFGEDEGTSWVVPIELKSGAFRGRDVVEQLQGGADVANRWLPQRCSFQFVPVLAHGKGVPKRGLKALRAHKIRLRDHTKQAVLIRCGETLRSALAHAASRGEHSAGP